EIASLPTGILVFTAQGLSFSARDEFVVGMESASAGILSRKAEIEILAKELKAVENELGECQSQLDSMNLLQVEERLTLKELDEKLRSQNQEVMEVMTELNNARQTLKHKTELRNNSQSQKQTLE